MLKSRIVTKYIYFLTDDVNNVKYGVSISHDLLLSHETWRDIYETTSPMEYSLKM